MILLIICTTVYLRYPEFTHLLIASFFFPTPSSSAPGNYYSTLFP